MRKELVIVLLLLLFSCAPKPKARVTPPSPELEIKVTAADTLRQKGCYVGFKQAIQVYQELYAQPEYRKQIAPRLVTTALLLAVREKELGIANKTYMDTALRVIKENPFLNGLSPYAEIAGLYWVQGKGVMRDIDERFSWDETEEKLKKMDLDLLVRAKGDEFSAYMYAVMKCYFAPTYGVSLFDKKDELERLAEIYPYSLLLKYKRAICTEEKPDLLKEILAAEPLFFEVNYHLGNEALRRGALLEAESYYLAAFEGISESPQIALSLAGIYFATEELERSLEFYEKTLAIAPEYRDALLGKGICLSYLGRPEEAITVLEKNISLGYWLLGESYYWLAWNKHEMKFFVDAAEDIEQAKGRLPTSSEVFTLSGEIASERGEIDKAEKDFKEALEYNRSNSTALFNLGSLYGKKEEWQSSGVYFEKAAFAFENEERSLEDKVTQIEKSTLSAERKERLLRKKKYQLEKILLSKSSAFYNAAASYLNDGQRNKALEMAGRAAEHPSMKAKADELVSKIK